MFSFNSICLIGIDQPYLQPNGLVEVSQTDHTLARLTLTAGNELRSILLTGEVGWRIIPFTNAAAQGRIEISIKRNGIRIYKKVCDLFLPEDVSCGRTSDSFTCLDATPPTGNVKYELTVAGSADNVDVFRVTGPVNFIAMGLK